LAARPSRAAGSWPLALLILATLVTGVTLAVVRAGDDTKDVVQPTPSSTSTTPSPSPSPSPSPTSPSPSPSPTPRPTPTEEPTEKPTEEPTEKPTDKPTDKPGNGGKGLAETGGAPAPFLAAGGLLLALAAGLWRLSRRPV